MFRKVNREKKIWNCTKFDKEVKKVKLSVKRFEFLSTVTCSHNKKMEFYWVEGFGKSELALLKHEVTKGDGDLQKHDK